jgi:hypothetical protein
MFEGGDCLQFSGNPRRLTLLVVRLFRFALISTFRIYDALEGYFAAQKMFSESMNRRASSMGKMVRPNGPALVQRSFHSDQ